MRRPVTTGLSAEEKTGSPLSFSPSFSCAVSWTSAKLLALPLLLPDLHPKLCSLRAERLSVLLKADKTSAATALTR